MATSKEPARAASTTDSATAKKTTTARKSSEDCSYAEQASDIGNDIRALVETIRGDLTDMDTRINDFHTNTTPETAEIPTADAVRRLAPAFEGIAAALHALDVAAADLTRAATS